MSDLTVQWIVVSAIVALCIWRIISSVRARRHSGGYSCGCGDKRTAKDGSDCRKPIGCAGCPLSEHCEK